MTYRTYFHGCSTERLARDVDQHLGPGLDLQLLASLHRQRTGAPCATDDQANRGAFTATGNTTDYRTDRRADTGPFHSLLGSAARLDTTFIIGPSRIFPTDRTSTRLNS